MPAIFKFLVLISCIGISACSEKTSSNTNNAIQNTGITNTPAIVKDTFETGKVIGTISANINAAYNFALYLPKSYSDSSRLPVIIFFDPHGDGSLPVNKYASLAQKHNFILIGSNNTKNGMGFEASGVIANALVSEAKTRFHVKQISLCGFSGGAKAAMLAGANNADVSNIIYCGAAQPWQTATHNFNLLGFAGLQDMNYSDMVVFHLSPQLASLPHYMIEWNGKHEWPGEKIFEWAFHEQYADIPANLLLKMDAQKEKTLNEEQFAKQQLIKALSEKDIDWWTNEIATLNAKKKNSAMYARLLGYVSLACYSYGNQTLQQNNLPGAKKILTIYQLADPDNKDCAALWQQYRQQSGQ